ARGKVDFTFGTEYRRQQGVNGTGNMMGFFFTAPIPVFDRNQGEIARAQAEVRRAELRVRAQEAAIIAELQTAYEQLMASRALVDEMEKRMLAEARQVREITEYSYRRGEATLLEFLDAQRAFNETMRAYNEARADYARNRYLVEAVAALGLGR
ncbi:MAG: TolC family protein, partial [Bryobacteraceae bacterium]